MKKRDEKLIFVTYASTGSGHTVAAKAIANELRHSAPDCEVCTIDILHFFKKSNAGDKFVSATSSFLGPVYDMTWRTNFTGRFLWGGGSFWPSFLYKGFEDLIIENKPDLVICTHQVCANSAAKARICMSKYFPIISVPTDYETEGLWPHKESDLFCVASEEMAYTLIARKVPAEKILISGLPISSDFITRYPKTKTREDLGLPKNKKIAIVIAGANASGPYRNIRKTLDGAIKELSLMDWMHYIFCVGNDAAYANKLMKKIDKFKADNISIMTYTDNLPKLMVAADIAIIKPGGLVITECASANLPILLAGKTYAQENINRRYLVSFGAAEHAVTSSGLVNLLCDIFSDNLRYKKLKDNISKLAKSQASKKISQASIKIMNSNSLNRDKSFSSIYIGNRPVHTR